MSSDVSPSNSRLVAFRNAFLSGALMLAPLLGHIWDVSTIIGFIGGRFRPLYEHSLPVSLQRIPFLWDMLATAVVILLVTLLGYLSNYVFGKYFLGVVERAVQRIPGIGA